MEAPKNEIVWVTYYDDREPRYIVTSKQTREYYFLYEYEDGRWVKAGKAETPKILEDRFVRL